MPPRTHKQPLEVMTWRSPSAIFTLSVAVTFDILRFASAQLWLFGPALAGLYCQQKLVGTLGETISTAVCATGASFLGVEASPTFMTLGVVLAMAVGILGWLTVGALVIFTNERLIRESVQNTYWLAGGLLVSEIPFIDSLPALTATVLKLYSSQIKRDAQILRAYKAEKASREREEREGRIAAILQARQAALLSEQETAYLEEAANDTQEEIPHNLEKTV